MGRGRGRGEGGKEREPVPPTDPLNKNRLLLLILLLFVAVVVAVAVVAAVVAVVVVVVVMILLGKKIPNSKLGKRQNPIRDGDCIEMWPLFDGARDGISRKWEGSHRSTQAEKNDEIRSLSRKLISEFPCRLD